MVAEPPVFEALWIKYGDSSQEIIKTMNHCGYVQNQQVEHSFLSNLNTLRVY